MLTLPLGRWMCLAEYCLAFVLLGLVVQSRGFRETGVHVIRGQSTFNLGTRHALKAYRPSGAHRCLTA